MKVERKQNISRATSSLLLEFKTAVDMESMTGKPFPAQVPLTDVDIGRAATEFLSASSERRKRNRAANTNPAELARKQAVPHTLNVDLARKSALALMQESPSFKRLIQLEEQLDLAIMRKQQAIREVTKADMYSEPRIFRLYIFNTYRSQPDSEGVTPDEVPSWSLRIQGKLLPKGEGSSSEKNVPPVDMPRDAPAAPATSLASDAAVSAATTTGAGAHGDAPNATLPLGTPPANAHAGAAGAGSSAAAGASMATGNDGQSASAAAPPPIESASVITGATPRCSDVFSRIVVELDKDVYPENNIIEWKRNDHEPSSDGFEISRAGSQEFTAKVYLFVDHRPTRFRLSDPLARLIGTQTETRSGIFASIWEYVKKHRLQCVDNRAAVRLDAGLKTLLGPANMQLEAVKLQQLFAIVKSHMDVADPLMIEYDVRLNGDIVDNQDCYDVHANVADMGLMEAGRQAGVLGMVLAQSGEFEALNERHLLSLEKLAHHKKRRDFFESFCSNPVQFINHLILSQTRDIRVLGGSTGRNPEEERRAPFYQQQWVHEAVPRYLLRKAIADTAEDTMESAGGVKGQ